MLRETAVKAPSEAVARSLQSSVSFCRFQILSFLWLAANSEQRIDLGAEMGQLHDSE